MAKPVPSLEYPKALGKVESFSLSDHQFNIILHTYSLRKKRHCMHEIEHCLSGYYRVLEAIGQGGELLVRNLGSPELHTR
jgi:ubiquinone/menaquinone biosynthesis C-methylase UbiE